MLVSLRRSVLLLIVLCSSSAAAQNAAPFITDYPTRPIRLIAPFATGGSTDVLARAIAPELSKRLGQQVIVENRTGAGGNIGIDAVAKAAPDGYTIGMASPGPIVVNVTLLGSLPYDPIKDLAPIAMVADLPIVLIANSSVQANNVKELIALERANPGKLSFASAGSGTTMHLSGELFNAMAGTKLVHVPYRGAGAAITDILGGQIQLGFLDLPSVAAHVKGGRIKLLAVGNNKRAQSAPDLPTIAESGVAGYETSGWFGVVAPARTPAAIIARLNTEIVNVMNIPSVRDYLLQQGIEPRASTPEQFGTFIKSEIPKWAEVIRFSGAKVN
jgi:tripartite-type tricarboxylate transporter receptor subunit TctC